MVWKYEVMLMRSGNVWLCLCSCVYICTYYIWTFWKGWHFEREILCLWNLHGNDQLIEGEGVQVYSSVVFLSERNFRQSLARSHVLIAFNYKLLICQKQSIWGFLLLPESSCFRWLQWAVFANLFTLDDQNLILFINSWRCSWWNWTLYNAWVQLSEWSVCPFFSAFCLMF